MKSKSDSPRASVWLLAVAAGGVLVGCGPDAGALLYFLAPPRVDVEAAHSLTRGPLLILVDFEGEASATNGKSLITDALARQLQEHEVNNQVIPQRRLDELRRLEPDFDTMGPVKIGKRLAADQVLWLQVRLQSPHRVGGDELISGLSCHADVRVVNARAKRREEIRVWPPGRAGGPGKIVQSAIDVHQVRAASTPDARMRLLADALAETVARLFYDHVITADNHKPGT